MAKGKVRINVQSGRSGHLGKIVLTDGTLLETCSHHHPGRGAAFECAQKLARIRGYVMAED